MIGVVPYATYNSLYEPILSVACVPFRHFDENGAINPADGGTFLLRTSGFNPLSLATTLRRLVAKTNPAYRVTNMQTQQELVDNHTIRERLLASLALFFATIALLLAAIGLYGVLNYSVLQREREIGIRIAVGARIGSIGSIARLVTAQVFVTVFIGAATGITLGMASARYVETLLFGVKGTAPFAHRTGARPSSRGRACRASCRTPRRTHRACHNASLRIGPSYPLQMRRYQQK